MNDDREIAAKSQHSFHFLGRSSPKLLDRSHQIFTRRRGISNAINACIHKAILHFVLKRQSDGGQFRRLQNPQNYLVTIKHSFVLLQNLCQFNNPHIYICLPKLKVW